MEGEAVGHNLKRDTPRDHLCQVWLHLAKLFQRSNFFNISQSEKKLFLAAMFIGQMERNGETI